MVSAAAAVAVGSLPAFAASQGRSGGIAFGAILLSCLVLTVLLPGFRTIVISVGLKAALEAVLKGMLAVPDAWLAMVALDDCIGLA